MGKLFKYLSIFIVTVIVIAGIAIAGLVMFVNPNDFKDDISKQAYKATGRTLTIKGDLKWSFFPWIGIEVNDATLSNATGFGNTPFADLGQAKVSIKFLPLLTGHIEAGSLSVHNLTLNLMKNAKGENNWQDMAKSTAKTTTNSLNNKPAANNQTTKTTNAKNSDKPFALSVSDVSLNNINVNYQDRQNNTKTSYTIQSLDSKHINLTGKTFPISIRAYFKSYTTGQQIKFRLSANIKLDMQKELATLSDFSIRVNNLQINGNASAKQIFSDDVSYQGNITVPSFDGSKLMRSFNRYIRMSNPNALKSVGLSATFSGSSNSLQIGGLKVNIDDTNVTGFANITNIQKLIGSFKLSLNQINLDNYQVSYVKTPHTQKVNQVVTENVIKPSKKAEPVVSKPKESGYQVPLGNASFNGEILAGAVTINKIKITNVSTLLNIQQGVFAFGPIKASIYGGKLRANLIADYTNPTPKYNFSETLNNVDIKTLVSAAKGKSRVSGIANINANLAATGKNNTQILRSLSGTAGFSIQQGQVQGFQLMQAINTASSLFFRKPATNVDNKATTFTNTAATFSISRGVASTDDLVFNSPIVKVTGEGSMDLVTQKLDMKLAVKTLTKNIPAIVNLQEAIGGDIPLRVKGTLDNPQIAPDMNKIAIESTKQKVGKQIKHLGDDLNKTGKDLGKQIKDLFK